MKASPRSALSAHLVDLIASGDVERWAKYHDDPLAFFEDVLDFHPWSKQEEIALAFRDGEFTTVVSANGVGKTKIAAALGLWFWRTRGPGCRVILTSATASHVTKALWKETRELYYGAKVPLGGTCARRADTGLRDDEGRELFGKTAETVESFQGIRAREMAIIADESSGIADDIFGAMLANLSGGGKLLLIGNGMRATGYFAKTHRDPEIRVRYRQFQISALDSPNVLAGEIVVRGLVTRPWVEDRAREWGKDSPWYKIRVEGKFVSLAEGAIFPPEMVETAEKRYETTQATGRLVVGLDPAGPSGKGDESAFVSRRGLKVLGIYTDRGLSADRHVIEVLGEIARHRGDSREVPLVVVDRDGIVGAEVYATLRAHQRCHEQDFELVGFRGAERPTRRPNDIHKRRDEMWFGLVEWFRDGGAIPVDGKLEADLGAIQTDATIRGLAKIIDKDALRDALGRSPDRGDALALSTYVPTIYERDDAKPADDDDDAPAERPLSPWAGALSPYAGGSGDPYGGDE
jgi:hypothetical protein